jgi:glucose/arabinose dehydrogenase
MRTSLHPYLLLSFFFFFAHFGTAQLPAGFNQSLVQSGYTAPMGMVFSNSGQRMWVWEKSGKIFLSNWNGTNYIRQSTPVLDISPEVGDWRDFGFMSIALDPNFATNGLIYCLYTVDRHHLLNFGTPSYSATTNTYFAATIHRVTRYKVIASGANQIADPASRTILLGETRSTGVPLLHESHGVGTLVFGRDGSLLISTGDNASYASRDIGNATETYHTQAIADGILRSNENVGAFRSQMITSHCGKILRINPTNGNGYTNNPFYDSANPRSAKSRVWAMGLRNPFRMCLWKGTGSNDPSDADPGTLLVGDVGWVVWEDFHVISKAGENCGWPYFEGLDAHPDYAAAAATLLNRDEPNPSNTCTKPFFTFEDLIDQERPNLNTGATGTLPCNNGTPAGNQSRFFHSRPALAWKHGTADTRHPIFTGTTPISAQVGTNGLTGNMFPGNAAGGSAFYTTGGFPAAYHNGYFFADYGENWIKFAELHPSPTAHWVHTVKDFAPIGFCNGVVSLEVNPLNQSLFVVNINSGEIRSITYGSNVAPEVFIAANPQFGASPLLVDFSSAGTFDSNGDALTYLWEFGDGTTSTLANPSKTYTAAAQQTFTARLTVRDPFGLTATKTLPITLNSTPPSAVITSPTASYLFSPVVQNSVNLTATVTDNNPNGISYQWQVILRHNNHEHAEPVVTQVSPTVVLSPVGCDGETYYYLIKLIVTDADGLIARDSVKVYPDCAANQFCKGPAGTGLLRETYSNIPGFALTDLTTNVAYPANPTTRGVINSAKSPLDVADNYGTRVRGFITPATTGTYYFTETGDNAVSLFLSTNANPGLKNQIAYHDGFTLPTEFTKFATQKSVGINLTAGQDFYIELLHKEEGGGDHWGIFWATSPTATPVEIPLARLSPLSTQCGVLTFNQVANVTVTAAAGATTAVVNYATPTASSTCAIGQVSVVRTTGAASGQIFAVGTTQICYTATDACGNTKTMCFNVVVNANAGGGTDCANITITPGASNITVGGLTAPITIVQVFSPTWTQVFNCSGNCLAPTQVISNLAAGTYFVKVDFLTAQWVAVCKKEQYITVTGGGGGTGVLTFNQATDVTVTAAAGATSAVVNYATPTASSTCATGQVTVTRSAGAASGQTFGVGTTQICYTATDGCGNTKTMCFNVVVNANAGGGTDCANITITPGASNITVGGLTAPITIVQVFSPTWTQVFNCSGNCLAPTQVISNLAAGTYFVKVDFLTAQWGAVCKKEQYITVTGGGGGTGVLTFNQATDVTVTAAAGATSAVVNYATPTASSTCATGQVTVARSAGAASGQIFGVGTTQICYTATDGCGNTKTMCFNVVVNANAGGGTDCNAITFAPGNGSIAIGNLTAPVVTIQLFDAQYAKLQECVGNCLKPVHTFSGLAAGTYLVKVNYWTAAWQPICQRDITVQVVSSLIVQGQSVQLQAEKIGNTSQLRWICTTSASVARFEVERAQEGQDFELIGTQNGMDPQAVKQDFSWVDKAPPLGKQDYRIKAVLHDGTQLYSVEQSLTFTDGFRLYPNPTYERFYLKVPSYALSKGMLTLTLETTEGRTIRQWQPMQGSDLITLEISDLLAGMYQLRIIGQDMRPEVIKAMIIK